VEDLALQHLTRPCDDHDGIGESKKCEQNAVVVNLPAAADHDENRQRIDPVHDAQRQWMQAARRNAFSENGRLCRLWHRQLPFGSDVDTELSPNWIEPSGAYSC